MWGAEDDPTKQSTEDRAVSMLCDYRMLADCSGKRNGKLGGRVYKIMEEGEDLLPVHVQTPTGGTIIQ